MIVDGHRPARSEDAEGKPAPDHPRWWVSIHDPRRPGGRRRDADGAVHALPDVRPADAGRRRAGVADAWSSAGRTVTGVNGALPAAEVLAEDARAPPAAPPRSTSTCGSTSWASWWSRGAAGSAAGPRRRTTRSCAWRGSRRSTDAAAEQAGRPHRADGGEHDDRGVHRGPDRGQRDLALGGRDGRGRAPHRAQPAGVRRGAGRPGLHARARTAARVRERRRRRGVAADAARQGAGSACSPTRRTRRPTGSTRRSATSRWSTWPTSSVS